MIIAYVLRQQRFWYCQDKGLYQYDSNNTPQPVIYVVLENSAYLGVARVHLIKKIFIFVFCLKIDNQHFTAEGSIILFPMVLHVEHKSGSYIMAPGTLSQNFLWC